MSEILGMISRRAMARCVVVGGVLAMGIVTVKGLESLMHATFDKPPAPLRRNFTEMATYLGRPVRYSCDRPDELLDEATVESLGTSEYLMRMYTDRTLKPTAPGSTMHLNVNYYATGSSTPHVPEICWAANGKTEVGDSRKMFSVPVARSDGGTVTLRMQMISFAPEGSEPAKAPDGTPMYENVAYVFHVNGEYVANPMEVTSHFWKASYRYAYHCKIEVTPMEAISGDVMDKRLRVSVTTQKDAERMISDFIKVALPEVEECLPDPAVLTAPAGTAGRETNNDRKR